MATPKIGTGDDTVLARAARNAVGSVRAEGLEPSAQVLLGFGTLDVSGSTSPSPTPSVHECVNEGGFEANVVATRLSDVKWRGVLGRTRIVTDDCTYDVDHGYAVIT